MQTPRRTISVRYLPSMLVTLMSAAAPLLVSHAATGNTTANVPDISGPWQIEKTMPKLSTVDGKAPPLTVEAQAIYAKHQAERKAGKHSFDPMSKCLPPGIPRLMMQPFPFNVVQGKTLYGFAFEWNHLNRTVYMNQQHFEPISPAYLGQSIGHWEGETLVIDTDNYNDMTLLDDAGLPHSDALHTVERIRLISNGQVLEDRIRIEDPKTFTQPWETVLRFKKKPNAIIAEDYCLGRTGQGSLQVK